MRMMTPGEYILIHMSAVQCIILKITQIADFLTNKPKTIEISEIKIYLPRFFKLHIMNPISLVLQSACTSCTAFHITLF